MKLDHQGRWLKGVAAGYTDVFPVERFGEEVDGAEDTHLVRGPNSAEHTARYRLNVEDRQASMNYADFPTYNERRGMELGVMRFEFSTHQRTEVKTLWWNNRKMADAAEVKAVERKESASVSNRVWKAQRKLAEVLLRNGQSQFRAKLDLIYGSRCCITGCSVEWALEAAHIEPYAQTYSNVGSSGILLRRDLHAMFDAGQLAIEPKTNKVYFAPESRHWPEYAELHETAVLAPPQPGQQNHAPLAELFSKSWERFREKGRHLPTVEKSSP